VEKGSNSNVVSNMRLAGDKLVTIRRVVQSLAFTLSAALLLVAAVKVSPEVQAKYFRAQRNVAIIEGRVSALREEIARLEGQKPEFVRAMADAKTEADKAAGCRLDFDLNKCEEAVNTDKKEAAKKD